MAIEAANSEYKRKTTGPVLPDFLYSDQDMVKERVAVDTVIINAPDSEDEVGKAYDGSIPSGLEGRPVDPNTIRAFNDLAQESDLLYPGRNRDEEVVIHRNTSQRKSGMTRISGAGKKKEICC